MDMNKDRLELGKEIEKAIKEGPTFGQSGYQSHTFNIAKHSSPGRSYRQVLLELNQRYTALKKCEIGTKRVNAQLALLKEKIGKESNDHERTILQCDLEDKQLDLENQQKLVMDAIRECNTLYMIFKEMKPVTAEEFEKEEVLYWEKRLMLDAELSMLSSGRIDSGTAMSLVNMGKNPLQIQAEIGVHQKMHSLAIEDQTRKNLLEKKETENA